MELNIQNNYIQEIKQILTQARQKAYSAVNTAMVEAYWLIGKRIVEEEQNGKGRAQYGKYILKTLSNDLTLSLGKGFSERSLREFRQFYQAFPDLMIQKKLETNERSQNFWRTPFAVSVNPIWRSAFANLHWSHYQRLLRINSDDARTYYLHEAAQQNWSVRTLDRNIATFYYQRLLSSQKKGFVEQEMKETPPQFRGQTDEFIKNPTVLEFLNLSTNKSYTELELEQALIDNLQQFLLELGKGFSFVARQKHIRTESSDFFIDLVFLQLHLEVLCHR